MESAQSVTIFGHLKATGLIGMGTVHLQLARNGAMSGKVTLPNETVQVVQIGSNEYSNAPASFWTALGFTAASARKAAGRWVVVRPSTGVVVRHSIFQSIATGMTTSLGPVTNAGRRKINGREVLGVRSSKQDFVVWLPTSGPALPVEITGKGVQITFTHWNSTPAPSAPTHVLPMSVLSVAPPP
jgi:hypothetical protein